MAQVGCDQFEGTGDSAVAARAVAHVRIAQAVVRLLDRLRRDDVLAKHFADRDLWRAQSRFWRYLTATLFGMRPDEPYLSGAHAHRGITDAEFERFLELTRQELVRSDLDAASTEAACLRMEAGRSSIVRSGASGDAPRSESADLRGSR